MLARPLILPVLLITISGCATNFFTKLESKPVSSDSVNGLIYRLPTKKIKGVVSYEVTGCRFLNRTDPLSQPILEAKISVAYEEQMVGDPVKSYTLDYQQLSGLTKVSGSEITLSEAGFLTTVNAQMSDHTGEIIQNVAGAAASVARAIKISPIDPILPASQDVSVQTAMIDNFENRAITNGDKVALERSSPSLRNAFRSLSVGAKLNRANITKLKKAVNDEAAKPKTACEIVSNAVEALDDARKKNKAALADDKKREEINIELIQLRSYLDGLEKDAESYKKFGTPELIAHVNALISQAQQDKTDFEKQLKNLGGSISAKTSQDLADAKESLVFQALFDFIPRPTSDNKYSDSRVVTPTMSELNKLFKNQLKPNEISDIKIPSVAVNVSAIAPEVGKNFSIEPKKIGIAYRAMAEANLKILIKRTNDNGDFCGQDEVVLDKLILAPQYGPIGSIDLVNRLFDDNKISLALNVNGGITKLTFEAKSAGEAASSALKNSAASYLQLTQDVQSDKVSAIKTETELQKGFVDLESSKIDLSTKNSSSQVDVAKNKVELVRSLQRLDAVKDGTATADEIELESLQTQQQILEAKLKIAKAKADLEKQSAGQ